MTEYRDAGVDIRLGESIKSKITQLVRSTYSTSVVTCGGEFGGVYRVPFSNTLAITSIDGVGTKLKVAIAANVHTTIGQDLVNHSVNDISVMGASPAYFVDYIAAGKLNDSIVHSLVQGIVKACNHHSMAVIGGETAQLPDIYGENDYDLAGAITGFMNADDPYLSRSVSENDVIVGFTSNGLHTNGYSLARHILFKQNRWTVDTYDEEIGATWGHELLKVHRSYYQQIRKLIADHDVIRIAHITGGGIPGNLARIIPDGLQAIVDIAKIPQQPVFSVLQRAGRVALQEMYDVFNMGCGLLVICPTDYLNVVVDTFQGDAFSCGTIVRSTQGRKVVLNSI